MEASLKLAFSRLTGLAATAAALAFSTCTYANTAQENALVLQNVTLLDLSGASAAVQPASTVVIKEGLIAYAGPGDDAPLPKAAQVIDGQGMTVMPGLSDMHVHVWDEASLGAYLAHGVTTIRNMSGMPFHLDMQRRIEDGDLIGPRLFTTGPILNSQGANAQINHQMVETAKEARDAVAGQTKAGFTTLKVYSNLKRDAYAAILEEADKRGMTITGHTPEGARLEGMPHDRPFTIAFEEILDDRFETIEHVESILWHGLADSMDEAAARKLAVRIAASGTPVTPTLVAHHNLVMMARTKGRFASRPGSETLNPVTQATEKPYIAAWSKQDAAIHEAKDAWLGRFTRTLDEAGVMLVTGSDAGIFSNIPGQSLIEELDLMRRGGMSNAAILKAATTNAARVLGESGKSGCLSHGCRADIVLLGCNPLAAIACTRHVRGVVRAGRWFDAAALNELLAAAAQPDVKRTIANLTEGMAAQGTPLDPAALGL